MAATATWKVPAGQYRLRMGADDGARVLIDDRVVLDNWRPKTESPAISDEFRLTAGDHRVRVEYFQITSFAMLQFQLQRLGD
jgi:hypothetical protein